MSCLLATTVVFSAGCSKDDDKDVPPADPEGTVIVFMRDGNTGAETTYITPKNCVFPFYINKSDNFDSEENLRGEKNWKFAIVGEKKGLAEVTEIPDAATTDWTAKEVAVKAGYGYVGESVDENGNRIHVRLYVKAYTTSAAGGKIGAEVRYQSPFLPTKK